MHVQLYKSVTEKSLKIFVESAQSFNVILGVAT